MKKYYIAVDGTHKGPFSKEELRDNGITQSTLIWTEELKVWTPASKVDDLLDLLSKIPPPIPQPVIKTPEKPLSVDSTKEFHSKPTRKQISAAKEIKAAFIMTLWGLLAGVVSLAVFYFGIYGATKYDGFDFNRIEQGGNFNMNTWSFDPNMPSYGGATTAIGIPEDIHLLYLGGDVYQTRKLVAEQMEIRKSEMTKKSFISALITFFVASVLLILIRFIIKSARWVKQTSKQSV